MRDVARETGYETSMACGCPSVTNAPRPTPGRAAISRPQFRRRGPLPPGAPGEAASDAPPPTLYVLFSYHVLLCLRTLIDCYVCSLPQMVHTSIVFDMYCVYVFMCLFDKVGGVRRWARWGRPRGPARGPLRAPV